MRFMSDVHRFRRQIAGASMLIAPLALLVSTLIHPGQRSGAASQLAVAAAHPSRWITAYVIGLVGLCFAVVAILGLMHILRERAAGYGHLGGALALVGCLAVAAYAGIQFVVWQMAQATSSTGAMTSVLDAVNHSAVVVICIYLAGLMLGIGLVVLSYGLHAARAASWWEALMLATSGVVCDLAVIVHSDAVFVIGAALLVVGMGAIGQRVLAETDDEWQHTPTDKPFKPLFGLR